VRWLLFVPVGIMFALGITFWVGMMRDDPTGLPSTMIGLSAPDLVLEPLEGPALERAMLDGDTAAGGLKLVNFWASWCAPCRVEHPNLIKLAEAGLPIYGINFKDDPAKARAFLAELGNPYAAIGADTKGTNGFEWGVYGVPETYLIDAEGTVLARVAGPVTTSTYTRDLAPVLEPRGIVVDFTR